MCKTYKNSEIVIGLVAPVGVDLERIQQLLDKLIRQFRYEVLNVRLSDIIQSYGLNDTQIDLSTPFKRIDTLMTAGNEFREKAQHPGILAMLAVSKISSIRKDVAPLNRYAHIIRSLKNPDEVMLLRRVYSHGFFLLGISSSIARRMKHLTDTLGMEEKEAESLIKRDEFENKKHGQRMRDVFHLADGFIDLDREPQKVEDELARIIELLFSNPFHTPTKEEYGMFLAYASSLRSGDLSRQVGAVIMSDKGEIISTGANDVPKFGGGLYWPDDSYVVRDIEKEYDSNEKRRNEIVLQIMKKFRDDVNATNQDTIIEEGKKILKDTGMLDITEYSRAVHAEMEAIISCLRIGVSPRGATLYCTTFPCHNCAKHIVASGIIKVIYIEPYPKSQALSLHADSICLSTESESKDLNDRVVFQPFVGVAHRRFIDLFSINKSTGIRVDREKNGKKLKWERKNANIEVPLLPVSYIERENIVCNDLKNIIESIQENN